MARGAEGTEDRSNGLRMRGGGEGGGRPATIPATKPLSETSPEPPVALSISAWMSLTSSMVDGSGRRSSSISVSAPAGVPCSCQADSTGVSPG